MHWAAAIETLILIGVANSAPVVGGLALRGWMNRPLDGGASWFDGRPLFGSSKTVRGLALSLVVTAAAASVIGRGPIFGLSIAALAMAGDLVSSFVKRRLALPSGATAPLLDQVPESLLPALFAAWSLAFGVAETAAVVLAFSILGLLLSTALRRIRGGEA